MGRQLGVIFGTLGGQDAPSSVQNASRKLINIKNVNFHQTLRLPIPQRFLELQDASQIASRSAQDGSKRLLKSIFFALENRLKFGLVLAPILSDLGSRNAPPLGTLLATKINQKIVRKTIHSTTRPKIPEDGPKIAERAKMRRGWLDICNYRPKPTIFLCFCQVWGNYRARSKEKPAFYRGFCAHVLAPIPRYSPKP